MPFIKKCFCNNLIAGLLLVLIIAGESFAQETDENDKRNSIALGFGFLPKHHDETFIPAAELSYMYDINDRFAAGLGAGIHFTQEPFYVIAARGDVAIYKGLGFGVLLGSAIQEGKPSLMAGAEIAYGFEWGIFELGPMVEISYHHKHEHFMIGFQLSYPF